MKTSVLQKDARLEGEYARTTDARTGAVVHQLTAGASINHGFFFLTPSFRPARPNEVGFVTHRGGFPQIALFDFDRARARVLTDRPDMLPFSPCFTPDGATVCYTTRRGEVRAVDVESLTESTLAHQPNAALGECAVSRDGRRLVTAFKHAERHGLLVVDLQERTSRVILEQSLKIIHPQFHPRDADWILYAGDPTPRLWMVRSDGRDHHCLHENPPDEFIVHESFLGTSDDLIFAVWPYRLARMNIHERCIHTIAELNAWHMVSSSRGDVIVTDTAHPDRGLLLVDPASGAYETLCHPGASCRGTQWEKDYVAGPEVWRALKQQAGDNLSWMEAEADQVYGPQWTHPHPAFDATGRRVTFTSDRSGHAHVYVVEAGPFVDRLQQRASRHG